jgi:transcription elongation factor GreB
LQLDGKRINFGMSKAFLREDDLHAEDLPPPPAVLLPPGTKNFLTAGGSQRLQRELADLAERRGALLARSNDPEAKRRAQILEQRIRYLQQSLRSAEIVPPATGDLAASVRFGATVTVRDPAGVETRYRLVGVDETDLERGEVSWLSPLAQALLNAHQGERIRFKAPRGETELEIVKIVYE